MLGGEIDSRQNDRESIIFHYEFKGFEVHFVGYSSVRVGD